MVVGIGFDVMDLSRMRTAVRRSGERFLRRVFTPAERAYSESYPDAIPHLAARFAAKEALFKAIGTGWSRGVAWNEAEVRLDKAGRPEFALSGRTAELVQAAGARRVHLSLTHIDQLAGAMVVIEGAEPREAGGSP